MDAGDRKVIEESWALLVAREKSEKRVKRESAESRVPLDLKANLYFFFHL